MGSRRSRLANRASRLQLIVMPRCDRAVPRIVPVASPGPQRSEQEGAAGFEPGAFSFQRKTPAGSGARNDAQLAVVLQRTAAASTQRFRRRAATSDPAHGAFKIAERRS
jgi:hypothetical protein